MQQLLLCFHASVKDFWAAKVRDKRHPSITFNGELMNSQLPDQVLFIV